MNDLEKAKLLIENKNNSLVDISRKYNIPVQTFRNLRHDPSKMKKVSFWCIFCSVFSCYNLRLDFIFASLI